MLSRICQSLVCNNRLAKVSVAHNVSSFIHFRSIPIAKAAADVFESCIAALYIEKGLSSVRESLSITIFPLADSAQRHREWLTPEQRCGEYLKLCNPSLKAIKVIYTKDHSRKGKDQFIAQLHFQHRILTTAKASTKKIAKSNAFIKLLQTFGIAHGVGSGSFQDRDIESRNSSAK